MINDFIITEWVIISDEDAFNKQQLSYSRPYVSVCVGYVFVCTQCLFLSSVAEFGDHCPSRLPGYLSKCHFIPEQDEDFLCKVEDLHPQHK